MYFVHLTPFVMRIFFAKMVKAAQDRLMLEPQVVRNELVKPTR
jgi:hypothetical protein